MKSTKATSTNEAETEEDYEFAAFENTDVIAVVTFHPQIWMEGVDNRAVTGDDTVTYTVPLEDALTKEGDLRKDDTDKSDVLSDHENAPEKAQNWEGPFYITIDEIRCKGES